MFLKIKRRPIESSKSTALSGRVSMIRCRVAARVVDNVTANVIYHFVHAHQKHASANAPSHGRYTRPAIIKMYSALQRAPEMQIYRAVTDRPSHHRHDTI